MSVTVKYKEEKRPIEEIVIETGYIQMRVQPYDDGSVTLRDGLTGLGLPIGNRAGLDDLIRALEIARDGHE